MTALTVRPPDGPQTRFLGTTAYAALRWHRPLMLLALAMVAALLVMVPAAAIDPRTVTGAEVWLKPIKFALSVAVYSVSWAFLIHQLERRHRLAAGLATGIATLLTIEMVIIIGQAFRGTSSHFNNTTTFDSILYNAMGGSIGLVWVLTLGVGILVLRSPLGDRARTAAVRYAILLSLVGMALGALMTVPTSAQLQSGSSIVGAHTVGLPDGGPGLPFVGWSTIGGDLRIGHFLGLHALQVLPLACLMLELAARRWTPLSDVATRTRLVGLAGVSYLVVIALITWQALRGESIVHPGALTLLSGSAVAVAALAAAGLIIRRGRRPVGNRDHTAAATPR